MNTCMNKKLAITARLLILMTVAFAPTFAQAAAITLTATDASGTTSFNAAGHWSNAQAPSAGNTYDTTTSYMMRTPLAGSTAITFAGDSLTLHGPGSTTAGNGRLDWAGTTGGATTINNLIVTN